MRLRPILVGRAGLEPARAIAHQILSLARLPIPPSGLLKLVCKYRIIFIGEKLFLKLFLKILETSGKVFIIFKNSIPNYHRQDAHFLAVQLRYTHANRIVEKYE